ncbi:MAG TPA: methyltransferase domain-containing protein [Stellaceae bacterium]|nr:methyltransferase domain-containing protein [Stellaceae bacterium]
MTANRAFGVDPVRAQFYSLRQSRYDALAWEISGWAGAAPAGARLRLLIVGCGAGTELRHLEVKPHFDKLIIAGTNIDDRFIYKRASYEEMYFGDFLRCSPKIPANFYDIVVCEQVLEHLTAVGAAIAVLDRALKPGGKLIVGVPIFPPPLHLVRKHVVPKLDRLLARRTSRGHLQAFSLSSFLGEIRTHSSLRLLKVRGFRVVSGGLLRRLDNYRWWWKFNRRLGELMPGLCIEAQAILEKPLQGGEERRRDLAAAPAADAVLARRGERGRQSRRSTRAPGARLAAGVAVNPARCGGRHVPASP